jgi:hypothetical protein
MASALFLALMLAFPGILANGKVFAKEPAGKVKLEPDATSENLSGLEVYIHDDGTVVMRGNHVIEAGVEDWDYSITVRTRKKKRVLALAWQAWPPMCVRFTGRSL